MSRLRRIWLVVWLGLVFIACGGRSLSVSEYAAAAEALVSEMEAQFREIDAEWESRAPSIERAEEYWNERLAIRGEFLDAIDALEPPDEILDMHRKALDVFGKMTSADEALAARVAQYATITDHWQWTDTAEGRAADAVLEDVFAFCRESQAGFDATQSREQLDDVSWLPSEATEIVKVAFGCPPQD